MDVINSLYSEQVAYSKHRQKFTKAYLPFPCHERAILVVNALFRSLPAAMPRSD